MLVAEISKTVIDLVKSSMMCAGNASVSTTQVPTAARVDPKINAQRDVSKILAHSTHLSQSKESSLESIDGIVLRELSQKKKGSPKGKSRKVAQVDKPKTLGT